MIKLTRRRLALGAVCAALALLPMAGWSTGSPHSAAASSGSSASSAAPGSSASSAAPGSSASPVTALGSPGGPALRSTSDTPGTPAAGTAPAAPGSVTGVVVAPPAVVTKPPPPSLPPVGWALTDVPAFPPAPAPEPIVLADADRVPFLSRIPVRQPVAFLTIDDGYLKPPEALELLAAAHIPVTLFLTTDAIRDDVPFFDRLRDHGAVVEAHTITHTELRGRSYASQKREICGSADRLGAWYGRRPVLFRPPFGDRDDTTLRVTHDCGMRAAFMWKETVDQGKVRYQQGHRVQRGDIILMHFRPAFVKDFLAALRAIHRAGLTPALLENYIPG